MCSIHAAIKPASEKHIGIYSSSAGASLGAFAAAFDLAPGLMIENIFKIRFESIFKAACNFSMSVFCRERSSLGRAVQQRLVLVGSGRIVRISPGVWH